MSEQRKFEIDTLRGLACILLVSFHVVGHNSSAGLKLDNNHPMHLANEVISLLRMPLFSFLSGFVYAWRPYSGGFMEFAAGKFRRLLVPMLIVGTFFAVIQANTPGSNSGTQDWSMLHIKPVAHFWFLESLFIIFMITTLLEHFNALSKVSRFATVWLAAAAFFISNPLPTLLGLNGAAYLFPFFLLGLGCNRFGLAAKIKPKLQAIGVLFFALAIYFFLDNDTLPGSNSLERLLLSSLLCLLFISFGLKSYSLAKVGVYSFGIYLFHSIFTAASRILLGKLGLTSTPLLYISGLLAGIFLSILAIHILRRNRYTKLYVLGESIQKARTSSNGLKDAKQNV